MTELRLSDVLRYMRETMTADWQAHYRRLGFPPPPSVVTLRPMVIRYPHGLPIDRW